MGPLQGNQADRSQQHHMRAYFEAPGPSFCAIAWTVKISHQSLSTCCTKVPRFAQAPNSPPRLVWHLAMSQTPACVFHNHEPGLVMSWSQRRILRKSSAPGSALCLSTVGSTGLAPHRDADPREGPVNVRPKRRKPNVFLPLVFSAPASVLFSRINCLRALTCSAFFLFPLSNPTTTPPQSTPKLP